MMCDECGIRPAKFHLATIIGEEHQERSLCAVCFAKYQKNLPAAGLSGLAGILNGILEAGSAIEKEKDLEEHEGLACDACGTTYAEFKKSGMVGCARCYAAFREPIEVLLNNIHGNTRHAGRIPGGVHSSASIRMNIERLRQQLNRAVADEAYEDAALLRDRIRALTRQMEEEEASEKGGAADVH